MFNTQSLTVENCTIKLVTCRAWFELAHEYDFAVENIITKNRKFEVCDVEKCNFLVYSLCR